MTVSGGGGCPGLAVLRAVEEALSLAPDSVTHLPLLKVEDIAKGIPRSSGPATPDHVNIAPAAGVYLKRAVINISKLRKQKLVPRIIV